METLTEKLGISPDRGVRIVSMAKEIMDDTGTDTFKALKNISGINPVSSAELVLCTYSYSVLLVKRTLENEGD